jgi:hypothetical protein
MLPWSLNQIQKLFQDEPERYLTFLEQFHDSESWLHRFFVAHQLGSLVTNFPERALALLEELSRDENDLVLEASAHSWSTALESDFNTVFNRVKTLREQGNYRERRTAALAPVEFYRDHDPTEAQKQQIESFWDQYDTDDRKGLRNLVESQILDRYVDDDN